MVGLSCLNRVPLWRLEQCSDGKLHLALLTSDWRSRYGNSSRIKWSWETSISFVSICPKFRQMRSTGQKMNNNGVWNVLESKNNSKQLKPACCYIFLQIICVSSKTDSLRNWLIGIKSQAEGHMNIARPVESDAVWVLPPQTPGRRTLASYLSWRSLRFLIIFQDFMRFRENISTNV